MDGGVAFVLHSFGAKAGYALCSIPRRVFSELAVFVVFVPFRPGGARCAAAELN
jgi:hypothetical protein